MHLCYSILLTTYVLMCPVPLSMEWVVQQSEVLAVRLPDTNFPRVKVSLAKNTEPLVPPKEACRALHGSSHPLGVIAWMNKRPL